MGGEGQTHTGTTIMPLITANGPRAFGDAEKEASPFPADIVGYQHWRCGCPMPSWTEETHDESNAWAHQLVGQVDCSRF